MSNPVKYKVTLLNLFCYRQDEADGDEIFIKHQKERIWPSKAKYHKMTEGEAAVHVVIPDVEKDSMLSVELWDYDFLTPNDCLGTFSMLVNERGGPFTADLKREKGSDDARYSLEWEVS